MSSTIDDQKSITLLCTPLRFYTQNDEDMLFKWIKRIKCIKSLKGIGRELHIYIPSSTIAIVIC